MTIHEANEILANKTASRQQLIKCLESLCKEYGCVQASASHFFDTETHQKSLTRIQELIAKIEERILKCTN